MKTRQVYCPFCTKDTKCSLHNSEEIFNDWEKEGQYEINLSDSQFNQLLDELEGE